MINVTLRTQARRDAVQVGGSRPLYCGAMKERPREICEDELARVITGHWQLSPASLRYAPVGFGDHHWHLTDTAGSRWFVTVSRLSGGWRGAAAPAGYADLSAAMRTVTALHGAGLEFAVAPVPDGDGEPLVPFGNDHAVAVFPHVPGDPGEFGDELGGAGRLRLVTLLARLHLATPAVTGIAPVRQPGHASRAELDAALADLAGPWRGGPYSEPARCLLAQHAGEVAAALARFGELAAAVAGSGLVVTHGEPHPGNLIRGAAALHLVDWDTAGLAPPERDLWFAMAAGSAEADHYRDLTGHQPRPAVLQLYRLRWQLDDIALAIGDFRAPHHQAADTELSWASLRRELAGLSRLAG